MPARLAIKIDVDTDRGTRGGVLPLARLCRQHGVPAAFFFSLGPDNTGKAVRRILRPGFFSKVVRTRVSSNYGWRTLFYGTLLPAPHIGRRNADIMREVRDMGFETGIHCHDHFAWQDYVTSMPLEEIRRHFRLAREEYHRIFGTEAECAAAPGWQCSTSSLAVYDEAGLVYASDTRGKHPFVPAMNGKTFRTPQLPTSLPTLDELLGRPEFPTGRIIPFYLDSLQEDADHVHTIHAELEGLAYAELFSSLLEQAARKGVGFYSLLEKARNFEPASLPVQEVKMLPVDGRSGTLAVAVD